MIPFYEIATLSFPILAAAKGAEQARGFVNSSDAGGILVGAWQTDIGTLGRVLILRRFENEADLAKERRRVLLSSNPFDGSGAMIAMELNSYAPFPFLPPIRTGDRGGIYEFRDYVLKSSGLAPTLTGWRKAVPTASDYTAHLVVTLQALDGPPRIHHIWGFSSLEERASLRSNAYATGVWPPTGGPDNIVQATSTIALSFPWSPLG